MVLFVFQDVREKLRQEEEFLEDQVGQLKQVRRAALVRAARLAVEHERQEREHERQERHRQPDEQPQGQAAEPDSGDDSPDEWLELLLS